MGNLLDSILKGLSKTESGRKDVSRFQGIRDFISGCSPNENVERDC